MPTYDYRCRKCGHTFELFHSIKDDGIKRCPRCKGRAQRVPAGGAGLLFKGSGFYITDYRSKDYKDRAKRESGGGETKPASGGGESGSTSGGSEPKTSGGGGESRPSPGGKPRAAPSRRPDSSKS